MLKMFALLCSLILIWITSIYSNIASSEILIHDLLPIEKDGYWGYADEAGRIIIQPQWEEVGSFSKYVARVSMKSDLYSTKKEFNYFDGLIDRNGAYILSPKYCIMETDNSYYVVQESNGESLFGYFDKESGFFQQPRYENIRDNFPYFMHYERDARIAVKENGKWGFIYRETGEVALPFIYDDILFTFCNGYALVVQKEKTVETLTDSFDMKMKELEKWLLINEQGLPLKQMKNYFPVSGLTNCGTFIIGKTIEIDQSMGEYYYEELYGLADINGEILITPNFIDLQWINGTQAAFRSREGLWGLIDEHGHILIDAQFISEYDLPHNID